MEYILETKDLTKTYGSKNVVNSVNLHIAKGDIYGFIGKNGAGKTTLMRLVLGLAFPTSGEIKLFGNTDLSKERARIGSLIEAPGLFKNCSAYENLKRFSILYGGTDEEIKDLLKLVGLEDTGNKKAGVFSLGMKQRLGIAIALLGKPEFLVLDEPINGLDPAGIKEIRNLLLKLNKEKNITIFIASHLIDELAKIATKYGIINNGNLIEEISADELLKQCVKRVIVKVDSIDKAVETLKSKYKDLKFETNQNEIIITHDNLDTTKLLQDFISNGVLVKEIKDSQSDFEDYFIERIGM